MNLLAQKGVETGAWKFLVLSRAKQVFEPAQIQVFLRKEKYLG
jgi:hypothetical protein